MPTKILAINHALVKIVRKIYDKDTYIHKTEDNYMNIQQEYNERLAQSIIKKLKQRQIDAIYCNTAEKAKEQALSYLTDNCSVSFGGSMTLDECGLLNALRSKENIKLYDRALGKNPDEIQQIFHQALSCDYYFMSTNAITHDGELVNIDGNGNRVAALIYGPKNVIIIAGMNKVAANETEAIHRVHNTATPRNCIRLNKNTPCAQTGICGDCLSSDCVCNQVVITRRSGIPGRIKVILVGENLGY